MTSFENPNAIRHFQSICDSCPVWFLVFVRKSDLKFYSDGYLQAKELQYFRAKRSGEIRKLIERWILDPSSFIDPEGGGIKVFNKNNDLK